MASVAPAGTASAGGTAGAPPAPPAPPPPALPAAPPVPAPAAPPVPAPAAPPAPAPAAPPVPAPAAPPVPGPDPPVAPPVPGTPPVAELPPVPVPLGLEPHPTANRSIAVSPYLMVVCIRILLVGGEYGRDVVSFLGRRRLCARGARVRAAAPRPDRAARRTGHLVPAILAAVCRRESGIGAVVFPRPP